MVVYGGRARTIGVRGDAGDSRSGAGCGPHAAAGLDQLLERLIAGGFFGFIARRILLQYGNQMAAGPGNTDVSTEHDFAGGEFAAIDVGGSTCRR